MAVRTTFVDKWNYTNRKRIKQKPELILIEQLAEKLSHKNVGVKN